MNNQLQNTLRSLIKSGWQSNLAMHKIINDYAEYHTVLVITGGLFTLILISLGVVFGIKFKKISETGQSKWIFAKKVYFSFGFLSGIAALFMALLVAVNATTAFNPLPGFSLLIDELIPSIHRLQLHHAYNTWLQSGSITPPTLIEQHIQRRVAFHSTKAIVCAILLIVFTVLNIRLWSTLITKCHARETKWRLKEKIFFVVGMGTIALSLLMMIIVIANLQGAFAPITLTLFFG